MRSARLLIGGVTLLAWFAISNHCVIDAAMSAPTAAPVHHDDCCPMHANKPAAPAQPKKQGDGQVCCKNLPATALKGSQPLASFIAPLLTILFDRHDLFQGARDELPSLCLDTGPPNALSFSELVLQQSLRAHAPPSIA
jgi:hypothetical protein